MLVIGQKKNMRMEVLKMGVDILGFLILVSQSQAERLIGKLGCRLQITETKSLSR